MHPDVVVWQSFAAQETLFEDVVFIASFLVSSSHETFVEDNHCFFGGGCRKLKKGDHRRS